MKYDTLIIQLDNTGIDDDKGHLVKLCWEAADAIKELQSTVVIVEVKENTDGT